MHILYNLFVLLTWNTSRFCAGHFGYRGNSKWSSLQLFTSLLKQTQMQNSRKCILYLDTAFITRDFNKADLRRIAPKFFQHISCNTRGKRTLGHCYSPFQDAYKSLPRPPLGKSDHSSVLLLHAYRQKLKREPEPHLDYSHTVSSEEGPPASLLPQVTGEIWSELKNPQTVLQLHCVEHPDWLSPPDMRTAPKKIVQRAQYIVRTSLQDIYNPAMCEESTEDHQRLLPPEHELISLLPSGRRYRSIRTRTSRTRDSFFSQAIRLLNYREQTILAHLPLTLDSIYTPDTLTLTAL